LGEKPSFFTKSDETQDHSRRGGREKKKCTRGGEDNMKGGTVSIPGHSIKDHPLQVNQRHPTVDRVSKSEGAGSKEDWSRCEYQNSQTSEVLIIVRRKKKKDEPGRDNNQNHRKRKRNRCEPRLGWLQQTAEEWGR